MNSAITPTPVRSPCVKVCEMDETTKLCKGCYRTQNEREWWVAYSEQQQRDVLNRCAQRRDAIRDGRSDFAPCMGTVESRRRR